MSAPLDPNRSLQDAATEAKLPERIGPFRIHGVLGRGSMGVVFDAETPTGQRAALKVLRPQGDLDRTRLAVARFLRESQILRRLSHPGIVKLIDAGDLDGVLYLAMERVEGVSLLSIRRRGPLALDAILALGGELLDALAHMHEAGVVHRDLKPANILIDQQGRPVITDFGISAASETTGITRHGDILGSPGFIPPEVMTDGAQPSPLSDQYALGRLLFEMGARGSARKISKRSPILEILQQSLEIEWERWPTEPGWRELGDVLRRMTDSDPRARFPDARAAREALAAIDATGHALDDLDTLSGHVSRLEIAPDHPWIPDRSQEVAAAQVEDQVARAEPQPPPRERFNDSKGLTVKLAEDDLIASLNRPAGEMPRPPEARTTPQRSAPAPSPGPEPPPPQASDQTISEGPRSIRLPLPGGRREEPKTETAPPATPSRPPPAGPPDAEAKTTVSAFGGEPVPEQALSKLESIARREPLREDAPELQIPKLHRQIQALKDQLVEERKQKPPAPKLALKAIAKPLAAAGAVCLVLGLGLGSLFVREPPPPPTIVFAPAGGELPSEPVARFKPGDRPTPTASDVRDARQMLRSADECLSKRDLDGAQRFLSLCIEIGDLADCHKVLGGVLAMTRSPAARAHLQRYLELAPNAPDAAAVRAALE